MNKFFIFLMVLLFSGGALWGTEIKVMKAASIAPLPQPEGNLLEIIHAEYVMGRFLASVKITPTDRSKIESFRYLGGREGFAPAWFTKDWKLIQIGPDRLYGADLTFTPVPSDIADEEVGILPVARFPQVLARDPVAEKCPYVFARPTKITCLDPYLNFEKRQDGFRCRNSDSHCRFRVPCLKQ